MMSTRARSNPPDKKQWRIVEQKGGPGRHVHSAVVNFCAFPIRTKIFWKQKSVLKILHFEEEDTYSPQTKAYAPSLRNIKVLIVFEYTTRGNRLLLGQWSGGVGMKEGALSKGVTLLDRRFSKNKFHCYWKDYWYWLVWLLLLTCLSTWELL